MIFYVLTHPITYSNASTIRFFLFLPQIWIIQNNISSTDNNLVMIHMVLICSYVRSMEHTFQEQNENFDSCCYDSNSSNIIRDIMLQLSTFDSFGEKVPIL
jgi:hypothetical protein